MIRLSVRLAWVCAVLGALLLGGCADEERALWQGYVEGDFVYVAPPLSGRLDALDVARGDTVRAGHRLFVLERGREKAAVDEAARALDEAESTLADRSKGLRPSEVAAVRARLKEARAAQRLAEAEYVRREALFAAHTISREELDTAHTAHEQAVERVREAQAELKTASLGSRDDAVSAARAAVEAARARLDQARSGSSGAISMGIPASPTGSARMPPNISPSAARWPAWMFAPSPTMAISIGPRPSPRSSASTNRGGM